MSVECLFKEKVLKDIVKSGNEFDNDSSNCRDVDESSKVEINIWSSEMFPFVFVDVLSDKLLLELIVKRPAVVRVGL